MPKIELERDTLYNKPRCSITGVYNFCSGALLHSVSAWGTTYSAKQRAAHVLPAKKPPFTSFEDYFKDQGTSAALMLPQHYAYCWVLEQVYTKAKTGRGGQNMYASQGYATKTWFMADRNRTLGKGSISTLGFMHWLSEQGVSKVGRIHISPWRDGAHGGRCKGAVYAPDLPRVKKFLDDSMEEVRAFIEERYNKIEADKLKADTEAANAIGALW